MVSKTHQPYLKTLDFARICRTNKRTLIHYEEIGLFTPALRGENGYRYYTPDQVDQFRTITLLKELGMPLAQIKACLSQRNPDVLQSFLAGQEEVLSQEIQHLTQLQTFLRTKCQLLTQENQSPCEEIQFQCLEEELLVLSDPIPSSNPSVSHQILQQHLARSCQEGWNQGYPIGSMLAVRDLECGRFHAYSYYFTEAAPSPSDPPLFRKPAGTYAILCHPGGTPETAFTALLGETKARGLRMAGFAYQQPLWDGITHPDPQSAITRFSVLVL